MPRTAIALLGLCLFVAGTGCDKRVQTDRLQRLRADECGAAGNLNYRLSFATDKLGMNPHIWIRLVNHLGPDCFMETSALDDDVSYAFSNQHGEWIAISGDGRSSVRRHERDYKRLAYRSCGGGQPCMCRSTTVGSAPLRAWSLTDTLTIELHLGAFLPTANGRHHDVELIIEESLPVADIDGIDKWKPPGQPATWSQAAP